MLTLLDRPVTSLAGRTPRELLLVGGALAVTFAELRSCALSGNIAVYLAFAAAMWLRLYAARGLLVALIVAGIAQTLPRVFYSYSDPLAWALHNWPLVGSWVAGLLLLCSRDLVERYDRSPSRHRWLPNFWAALDPRHARWLRWSGYCLSASIGASVAVWRAVHAPPAWLLSAIVVMSLASVLLCLGRAVVLALLPVLAGGIGLLYLGHVGRYGYDQIGSAPHAIPAMIAVIAAGVLALPYAVRVLRRV